jgi:hypothetical protein
MFSGFCCGGEPNIQEIVSVDIGLKLLQCGNGAPNAKFAPQASLPTFYFSTSPLN